MVQQRINPGVQPREYFPSRETTWADRTFVDLPPDGRFNSSPSLGHEREKTIEGALKDCARIPVKEFALVAVLESGEQRFYSSQSLTPYQPRIFTESFKADFRRCLRIANDDGQYPNLVPGHDGMFPEADLETMYEPNKQPSSADSSSGRGRRHPQRQSRSEESDEDGSASARRKRPRGSLGSRFDESNDNTPVPVQKTKQLRIGDSAEVESFYTCRFRDMQQSSCKVMGKAFVKLVEPKKQTHHPYTKGNEKAPPWWPSMIGENNVRHKEPDHLLKPERIRLLVHILRMVVEPRHKQCAAAQKLGLNVKKLEEATMEAMSNWFNDKAHPENAAKRPFLKEIFKIAKAEERYKNGEIDGTTYFPVMHGERNGQDGSDDEVEEGVKDEDDDAQLIPISNMSPSESLSALPMMQNSSGQSQPDFRTRTLPVRYQAQPRMEEQLSYADANYSRNGSISFQPPSPLHDSTRRSFASTGYQSPQPNIYGWQNNIVNAQGSSNFFVPSPTPGSLSASTAPSYHQQPNMLPPLMGQHHFEGLQNGRQYDTAQALGNQLRTGSMGQPHSMNHGFQDYMHHGNEYGHGDVVLKDESHLHAQ